MRTWPLSVKIPNHKFPPAIVGLCVLWLIIAALPDAAFAQGPIEVLEEFPISAVGGSGFQAISGDIVVFDRNSDIYGYDLVTHTGFRITHHGKAYLPNISGDTVVWQDYRNGNWDIYGYDLSEEREFRITWNAADQKWPAIDGNTVVWVDWRNGSDDYYGYGYDLYSYDMAKGTESRITGQLAPTVRPAISGNTVVWSDRRYGGWDLYSYDLQSHTETQITRWHAPSPYVPVISDGVIVLGEGDFVTGLDLSGNLLFETQTQFYPLGSRPAIDGNLAVWYERFQGFRPCEAECPPFAIIGYDIPSDHTFLVHPPFNGAGLFTNLDISGNVIVWRAKPYSSHSGLVYAARLLETVRLSVNPQFVDAGDVLTYTIALAEASTTGSHRNITDSLSSLVVLDTPSLSATSGDYGYLPSANAVTWVGDVSAHNPVTITYNATVSPDASVGERITNTAVISDETSIFTRTITSWIARRTYLPVIMHSAKP
jgi:uncharacterized repeat protein (TIGR01451 family)